MDEKVVRRRGAAPCRCWDQLTLAAAFAKRGNADLRLGVGTRAAHETLRSAGVSMLTQDRVFFPDIRTTGQLLRRGDPLREARRASGRHQI